MRALEHKTYSTANELMALEQLDELRKINKRLLNRESTVDDALAWLKLGGLEKEDEEEKKRLEGKIIYYINQICLISYFMITYSILLSIMLSRCDVP